MCDSPTSRKGCSGGCRLKTGGADGILTNVPNHAHTRAPRRYKAQLESELYQKKLADQQKQNEEWLSQQHQQYPRLSKSIRLSGSCSAQVGDARVTLDCLDHAEPPDGCD